MKAAMFALLMMGTALISPESYAQKQMVLLKGQKVILRLYPGDEIVFTMRGSEDRIVSYINNLYDTALLAHEMLVPFSKIERIYFDRPTFVNKIGRALVVGGVGFFLVDQLNTVVVRGEEPSLNDNVTRASVAMVAAGLPMALIRKKSQRMKGGYRVLSVGADSPFYQRDIIRMSF